MSKLIKNESKNIYLHLQIADILRRKTETSALSITDIYNKLKSMTDFQGTRKTVARNIQGMSDDFKLQSTGERPAKYWIDSSFEPEIKIGLNPTQLQIITYALRNLKHTSIKPLAQLIAQTEATLFSHIPAAVSSELKYALKSYSPLTCKVAPTSYPKNNINDLFVAIRKKSWITAKIKELPSKDPNRDIHRKLAIVHIWFIGGVPMVKIYDGFDKTYKELSATRLNHISVLHEKVSDKFLSK